MAPTSTELAVIGAGPIGLACGIAARRAGLDCFIFDRGGLANSFIHYPTDLEFFSTPELLEIGGIPFTTRGYKPVRAEALEYYRHAARSEQLDLRLYEQVDLVEGEDEGFTLVTDKGRYGARKVVVATGFFDVPIRLDIPGEELPKVTHYYREPYPYVNQRVAVIGAKNSAAKAALDCYRHGAEVTLLVRGPAISDSVKYWIKPDLDNRIRDGVIKAYFNATVRAIEPDAILFDTPEGPQRIGNDWVLAMTGYRPDTDYLHRLGIAHRNDAHHTPVHDPETMETNRRGMYLAGVVCGGLQTSVWFIENSRVHADRIVRHITAAQAVLPRG
jgi:thioredoxin reductase (NADPH)